MNSKESLSIQPASPFCTVHELKKFYLSVCGAVLLLVSLNGCAQYKVVAKGSEPATDITQTETIHSILWGLVLLPGQITPQDCQGNGLAEAIVRTNFWYTAASVITLGIYSPLQVQWRCAKDSNNEIDIGKIRIKGKLISNISERKNK